LTTRLCVDLLDLLLVHDDRVDKVPVQLCLLLVLVQLDPLALLQSGLSVDLLFAALHVGPFGRGLHGGNVLKLFEDLLARCPLDLKKTQLSLFDLHLLQELL